MDEPSFAAFIEAIALFRDPLLCGAAAGAVLGAIGVFVVLRRMVFVTATLSQASGLGVALAFYAQIHLAIPIDPAVGAIGLALVAAAVFALARESRRLSRESVLGGAYLVAGALAVMIGDRISQEAHEISSILFGTAVLVRVEDLWLVLGIGALVAVVHGALHRGFLFASFDPEGARVQGVPVLLLDALMWSALALMVAVSTRALGALPVFAFAVLPAMAALLLGVRVRTAMLIGGALGAASAAIGYVTAFLWSFPVGATQAAVSAAALVVVWAAHRALLRG